MGTIIYTSYRACSYNNSSAVAEMGDRATAVGRKVCVWGGGDVPLSVVGAGPGSPSNTVWPRSRPISVPSGISMHLAV